MARLAALIPSRHDSLSAEVMRRIVRQADTLACKDTAILGISRSTAYAWIARLRLKDRYRGELRRNDEVAE